MTTVRNRLAVRSQGLALLIAMFAGLGCAGWYSPTPAPPMHFAPYQTGAPDHLVVTILPEPMVQDTVIVRPDGMITIQLIGDVPASGRTLDEVANDIQTRIGKFKRGATVTVALASAESSSVTVMGEVRRPSEYPLTKHTRVAEVIAKSGGFSLWANVDDVQLVSTRSGEPVVYDVNLAAVRSGDMSTNYQVYAGDIVYVPPTGWARVGYAVNAVLWPFQPFIGIARSAAGASIAP